MRGSRSRPTSAADDATQASLVSMSYAALRLSVVMTVVVCIVFPVLLFPHSFSAHRSWTWSAVLMIVALARYGLWLSHRRADREGDEGATQHWHRRFVLGAVAAGASWSVGPALLIPGAPPASALLLALVVLAVSAVSIGSLTANSGALIGFVLSALLPTVVLLAAQDEPPMRLGASIMLAAMVALIIVGRRASVATRSLVEADLRATELDRMKSAFLGMASHELRTPMTGIVGFAELLSESSDLPERSRTWVATIGEEADRLQRIIDDLLNVSRIEAGRFSEQIESVPLAERVSTALRSIEPTLGDQFRLTVDVEAQLCVLASPQRLLEVLENLASNAVKYSPNGGRISVVAEARPDRVLLHFKDEGLGIPSDAVPRLFQRFERVEARDRAQIRGTGLGLYIAKRYAESFNGDIEVSSEEGVGSTFTVVLVRARDLPEIA